MLKVRSIHGGCVGRGHSVRFRANYLVGRLGRNHHNSHGQPRGNEHKMQDIIDGLTELFADYPLRLVDPGTEN